MAERTVRQIAGDAEIFGKLREDAMARGYLLAAFTYGLSAIRLYADALELAAANAKAART